MAATEDPSEMSVPPEVSGDHNDSVVVVVARGLGVAARSAVRAATFPGRAFAAALQHVRDRGRRRLERGDNGGGAGPGLIGRRFGDAARGLSSLDEFAPARLAADEGLNALAQALSDPDPAVRMTALDVVCEFSADRAARLLAGMIHDPDASVRCAAAAAAARLRVVRAVSSLIVALDDPDASVRSAAAHAIEEITGRQLPPGDEQDSCARREKVEQLKRWWKEERLAQLTASFPSEEPG